MIDLGRSRRVAAHEVRQDWIPALAGMTAWGAPLASRPIRPFIERFGAFDPPDAL